MRGSNSAFSRSWAWRQARNRPSSLFFIRQSTRARRDRALLLAVARADRADQSEHQDRAGVPLARRCRADRQDLRSRPGPDRGAPEGGRRRREPLGHHVPAHVRHVERLRPVRDARRSWRTRAGVRDGPDWVREGADGLERRVPLYEAKMIHHFDHRWATYRRRRRRDDDAARDVTLDEKRDPAFEPQPRYWVPEDEVTLRAARVPSRLKSAWRRRDKDPEACARVLGEWLAGAFPDLEGRPLAEDDLRDDLRPRPRLVQDRREALHRLARRGQRRRDAGGDAAHLGRPRLPARGPVRPAGSRLGDHRAQAAPLAHGLARHLPLDRRAHGDRVPSFPKLASATIFPSGTSVSRSALQRQQRSSG